MENVGKIENNRKFYAIMAILFISEGGIGFLSSKSSFCGAFVK